MYIISQEFVNLSLGSPSLIQFGLPLPKGEFQNGQFLLVDQDKMRIPFHSEVTSYWADQSPRWCLITALIPPSTLSVGLAFGEKTQPLNSREPLVTECENKLLIRCSSTEFEVSKQQLSAFSARDHSGHFGARGAPVRLVDGNGKLLKLLVTQSQFKEFYSDSDPLMTQLTQQGVIKGEKGGIARFSSEYKFHYQSNTVDAALTLHNPNAAKHLGGTWDLGDPNALLFKELSLQWRLNPPEEITCFDEYSGRVVAASNTLLSLYQESSGGENWNSKNHLNRELQVPFTQKGYRLKTEKAAASGDRIEPVVSINARGGASITLAAEHFWQKFPSKVQIQHNLLELSLFPAEFPDLHELQPGEKATKRFVMEFSSVSSVDRDRPSISAKKAHLIVASQWVEQCNVLPWFKVASVPDPIQQIIGQGLQGDNNFDAKRERVDEYGWRNYGELYADHEAEGYEGEDIFVSHYNNQYDPVLGLYRQSWVTAVADYQRQAMELSRHVTDIDIYDTEQDKDDYNKGLFWHTDHYQKAETSTHRTYSKHHQSGIYIDHAGGGGPGGQHCYTEGLTLDYWLTGNQGSKQAVLGLTDWITNLYEGKGTLIEFLLGWKNRGNAGLKSFWSGQYPLDRGIGNYIHALLDSYALTHRQSYLDRVAQIIRNTVHPADQIAEREFDNVEATWFYTVFFQALARYLWVKLEREELDPDFLYARDSLTHYACWMTEYEDLTLKQPEKLEFPNLTWTAQDLRKVNVLYLASYFSPEHKEEFQAKAEQLYQEIVEGVAQDQSRINTRVMVILMQNHGVREWVKQATPLQLPESASYKKIQNTTTLARLRYVGSRLFKALANFSVKNEFEQLNRRFPQIMNDSGTPDERD